MEVPEDEHRRILKYMELCMDQIGLPRYTIYLMDEDAEEGAGASIENMPGLEARVRLSPDWMGYKVDAKRQMLWHECAHLILRQLNDEIDDVMGGSWVSFDMKMHMNRVTFRNNELITQGLEAMMRRMQAFPAWPKVGVERLPLRT